MRSLIRQQHQDLDRLEVDVVDILPFLKGNYQASQHSSDFQYFPGINGAKHVLLSEDESQVDEPIYAFENLMPMDVFGREVMNQAVEQDTAFRARSRTKVHELIPLTDWAKHVLSYQVGRDEQYLVARQIRFLDNPVFDQKLRLVIKGNRVRIVCAHQEEAWGVVIKSRALADSLLATFQVLWLQATPVTLDLVKSWGENQFLRAERVKK